VLAAVGQGDPQAAEQLLPLIYAELRQLAAQRLARERPGQTLQPTALVHEAYLRLVDVKDPQRWEGRGHFFAAAAEAMRRILVERARRKGARKRGGGATRVDLDEALGELERHDAQAAGLVKLRYFAGLSHQEAAEALGVGRRAADRLWRVARAWLYQRLGER
jgi:DNA-directed RNA polymerase specialized sigma24 family protein